MPNAVAVTSPSRMLSQGLTSVIAISICRARGPASGDLSELRVQGVGRRRRPPRGPTLRGKFEKAPEKDILGHYSFRQKVTEPSF